MHWLVGKDRCQIQLQQAFKTILTLLGVAFKGNQSETE